MKYLRNISTFDECFGLYVPYFGQLRILVDKNIEIFIWESDNSILSPFYCLWALSLSVKHINSAWVIYLLNLCCTLLDSEIAVPGGQLITCIIFPGGRACPLTV